MIPTTFIVAAMALAVEAAQAAQTPLESGWTRVGCVRLEGSRADNFPTGYKLSSQSNCFDECGSTSNSPLAMIGGKCWCSSSDIQTLTVLTGGDFNCVDACFPDDPSDKSCGLLVGDIQYYNLYKQTDCDVKVVVKPGYPVPPPNAGASTTAAPVSTPTPTKGSTTSAKGVTTSQGGEKSSATGGSTSGASTTSTAPATSDGTKPYLSGVFSASIVLMMASFLV